MPVLGRLQVREPEIDRYRPMAGADVAERRCGAEGCSAAWVLPWKKRTRPIFEQEWACSGRCLEKMVRAAVRRETGDSILAEGGTGAVVAHRHRVPLGLVLLAQGWITHPQLQAALQAQRASGRGRIGDWLAQSCGLEEERIARGLGVQWNCPVLKMDGFSPAAMALVMPKRFVTEFGLVPLRVAGGAMLYVAFAERRDAVTALALEQMSGLSVEHGLLAGSEFELARTSLLAAEGVPVKTVKAAHGDDVTEGVVRALGQRQPVASRLVRVHQYYWLRMWLESGVLGGAGMIPVAGADVEDWVFVKQ